MAYFQKQSRRRNHRFDRPELSVTWEGLSGRSENWSLGGVAVSCEATQARDIATDSVVSGTLSQVERPERYDFVGRVVRIDRERSMVAVEFSKLSPDAVMMFIHEFRQMIGGAA